MKNNIQQIIFVTHHLGGAGGVQKSIQTAATQFLKDGYGVTVIGMSMQKKVGHIEPLLSADQYEEICLYTEDIFTTRPDKLLIDSFISKKSARSISAIIGQYTEPIIIASNPLTFFFLKNVPEIAALRTYGQFHSSTDFLLHQKGMYVAYRYFIQKYYRNLTKFLLLTATDAEEARAHYGWDNISYVSNPLPFEVKEEGRSQLINKTVVMIGRLDAVKRLDKAILLFEQSNAIENGWKLEIYGEGSLQDTLREQISALKVADNVILMGYSSNVQAILQQASISMLTSAKEGQPMSIMESMAYGVPVLAFNCSPGVAELLAEDTTLINQDADIAFINALNQLVSDATYRTNISAQQFARIQSYTAPKIAQKWYSFFANKK